MNEIKKKTRSKRIEGYFQTLMDKKPQHDYYFSG